MPFKERDRVQVVTRQATAEDVKSNLFYNHYCGLTGTVQKIFNTGEIGVTVDEPSLPEAIRARHEDVRQGMKTKWLDGLSEEARGRLSDQEKDFILRYTILVAEKDLTAYDAPAAPQGAQMALEGMVAPEQKVPDDVAPKRKTAAEIEADEEEYLRTRKGSL